MAALRVLIPVLLLLNGLAIQHAGAVHAAAGPTSHAGHGLDPSPLHQHGDSAAGECCEISACDCGCAVPQAATLPILVQRISSLAALTVFPLGAKSFHSTALSAPFRPPA